MNHTDDIELRKEFQLERIILFSDAVFAIIITIMVIELRLPEAIREATKDEFMHAVHKLYIQFAGYGLSFFFVAMFWMRHVKLLGFLKDYNRNLLVLNLLFLFCISLFPFAVTMITGFGTIKSAQAYWGFNIYVFVIMFSMLAYRLLASYMVKHKSSLCFATGKMEEEIEWKLLKANFYMVPGVLLVLVIFDLLQVELQYCAYLIAVFGIITARLKKHYYPAGTNNKTSLLTIFSRRQKKSRRA